jgi:hypothetical protein
MTWRGENSWPYRDSNPDFSVVQPVASRYTDYGIQAPFSNNVPILTSDFIFHASHLAGGIVDTTENMCQESRPLGQELSQGPHEYETRISIQPVCVIRSRTRTGIYIGIFLVLKHVVP